MIEEVVEDGSQGVVGNPGRSRSGGSQTKKTEKEVGWDGGSVLGDESGLGQGQGRTWQAE